MRSEAQTLKGCDRKRATQADLHFAMAKQYMSPLLRRLTNLRTEVATGRTRRNYGVGRAHGRGILSGSGLCQKGILSAARKEFCEEGILSGRNSASAEFCQEAGSARKDFVSDEAGSARKDFCQKRRRQHTTLKLTPPSRQSPLPGRASSWQTRFLAEPASWQSPLPCRARFLAEPASWGGGG